VKLSDHLQTGSIEMACTFLAVFMAIESIKPRIVQEEWSWRKNNLLVYLFIYLGLLQIEWVNFDEKWELSIGR